MLTTGHQLAAARALLGMDQAELAARSGFSANTIRNMEKSGQGPIAGRSANVHAVQRALEAAGVEFLNHGQPGVRLVPEKAMARAIRQQRKAEEPLNLRAASQSGIDPKRSNAEHDRFLAEVDPDGKTAPKGEAT